MCVCACVWSQRAGCVWSHFVYARTVLFLTGFCPLGCPVEYQNIRIPKGDPQFDPDGTGQVILPFVRTRYDFNTGYSPNFPRQQLNEITPFLDGGLFYGVFKAWADALRVGAEHGQLACSEFDAEGICKFPAENFIGLPIVNPVVPLYHALLPAKRFWGKLVRWSAVSCELFVHGLLLLVFGNPRGNENPMMAALHVLWFRCVYFRLLFLFVVSLHCLKLPTCTQRAQLPRQAPPRGAPGLE